MADIVNFFNKEAELDDSNVDIILEEVTTRKDIKDLAIFYKDQRNDFTLLYSNSLTMSDKAFLIQMLQHDIFTELTESEEITYEPTT